MPGAREDEERAQGRERRYFTMGSMWNSGCWEGRRGELPRRRCAERGCEQWWIPCRPCAIDDLRGGLGTNAGSVQVQWRPGRIGGDQFARVGRAEGRTRRWGDPHAQNDTPSPSIGARNWTGSAHSPLQARYRCTQGATKQSTIDILHILTEFRQSTSTPSHLISPATVSALVHSKLHRDLTSSCHIFSRSPVKTALPARGWQRKRWANIRENRKIASPHKVEFW